MVKRLSVRLHGRPVGVLAQDQHGQLSFAYDDDWMRSEGARPISQSLPFEGSPFGDRAVKAFFGGYLPDEHETRVQIGKYFGISANSMFQMLGAVGRDCAGALSLYPMDEQPLEDVDREPEYETLDEVALASMLRELERRPLLAGPEKLRLSLAGAQSKTAVYVTEAGEIALTKHDYPSTHIIKPALRLQFEDLELIEYYCLELGRLLGLPAPDVQYGKAEGTPYLMIERYDRFRGADGRIQRLHQEDFCQALGIPSEHKYEKDGGPGLAACFDLCDRLPRPAVERLRLLDVVILNFLIGNADAHGKNFSILYGAAGPELAPLYDVVSTLVYEADDSLDMDARMAMRIGKRYDGDRVGPSDWQKMAGATDFAWPAIRERIDSMSHRIQFEARKLERSLAERSLTTPILHRAVDLILQRAERIRETHDLASIPPEDLPGRVKYVGIEEGIAMSDDVTLSRRDDERIDFDNRYRRFMTRLWRDQQRARRAAQTSEDQRLGKLGREFTAAQEAWRSDTASEAQKAILRTHLGHLSGESASRMDLGDRGSSAHGRVRMPADAEAGKRVIAAEASAVTAAHVQWPNAVFLCSVPSDSLDLVDEFLSESSRLHRLLSQPPRWRQGGWDLFAGRTVETKQGQLLRVATPGCGSIEVWRDGTVGVAFAPRFDVVSEDGSQRVRLNGLELAERLYLFGELVNAVAALSSVQTGAVQFSIRMRKLRESDPPLVLGPNVPGTFGWQFGTDLHGPEVDELTADEVWPALPVDSGRMAYSLMRHVYLGFGVSTDALPFVEIRSGNRAVSKDAFMAFVNKLQR